MNFRAVREGFVSLPESVQAMAIIGTLIAGLLTGVASWFVFSAVLIALPYLLVGSISLAAAWLAFRGTCSIVAARAARRVKELEGSRFELAQEAAKTCRELEERLQDAKLRCQMLTAAGAEAEQRCVDLAAKLLAAQDDLRTLNALLEEQAKAGTTTRPRQPDCPWLVLGLERDVPLDQVHRAYKGLIVQYHPDKVHRMGERIKQVAEDESKRINAAYEAITRGERAHEED